MNWTALLVGLGALGFAAWNLLIMRRGDRRSRTSHHIIPSPKFGAALNLAVGSFLVIGAVVGWAT